ncbi:hypothetical protein D910_02750 [Dendroctonus ponderosae]
MRYVPISNHLDHPKSMLCVQKRALWKYSTERASIAARWTWLQSQISDLEYRIRQHAELNKRLTTVKGVIELGEVVIRPKPVQSQPEIAGHHGRELP